jgi:hypothetical protein
MMSSKPLARSSQLMRTAHGISIRSRQPQKSKAANGWADNSDLKKKTQAAELSRFEIKECSGQHGSSNAPQEPHRSDTHVLGENSEPMSICLKYSWELWTNDETK